MAFVLWFLLAGRMLLNDVLLEPVVDEGGWLWNARCEHWGLPTGGLVYSVLSPLNHLVARLVFAMTGPSIIAIRVLNSALIAVSLLALILRLHRRRQPMTALLLILWLWIDPYLFRAASWAILEPKLAAGLVVFYLVLDLERPWHVKAPLLGLVTGLLVAVKITVVWLLPAVLVYLAVTRRFGACLSFGTLALVMAGLLHLAVYAQVGAAEFVAFWHLATRDRLIPGTALWSALWSRDPRMYFYLASVAGYVGCVAALRRPTTSRFPSGIIVLSVVFGIGFLSVQSYLPERYLFPLALLTTLDIARRLATWPISPSRSLLGVALVLLVVSNALYARVFLLDAHNAGGWALSREIAAATRRGEDVAAPAWLSIGVNYPVQPTSHGAYVRARVLDRVPTFYVYQAKAAKPAFVDIEYEQYFAARGVPYRPVGFYRVYHLPSLRSQAP
jgi:hypothetical protein